MADKLGRFVARVVHLQDDEQVAMVGLADDQFDTAKYIVLQRTLCPSEQDVSLGLDVVHVMVCDQQRSSYGGLISVSVADHQVSFAFDQHAADVLQIDPMLVVEISATDIDCAILVSNLRYVCGDDVPVIVAD